MSLSVLFLAWAFCLASTANSFLMGDTCLGRCNKSMSSKDDYNCQCNVHCTKYNDCCDDYNQLCVVGVKPQGSCLNRCGKGFDSHSPCQCNSHCTSHGDCCSDYQSRCVDVRTASTTTAKPCLSFSQMGQALWTSDISRLGPSDIALNYQTKIRDGTSDDRASYRLFSKVDESKLNTPTFKAFLGLMNNYNPTKGSSEYVTSHETSEINAFLDSVLSTKVMDVLLNFLQCQGKATTKSDLKGILHKLWFQLYRRSSHGRNLDTCGFEHVLLGEYSDSTTVNGFHSWLSFYTKEKEGSLNYLGYVAKQDPNLVGPAFKWNGHLKTLGSFFVGASPEFDMAVYTLCYLQHKGDWCHLTMDSHRVDIKTYDTHGHIATAFVKF